MTTFTEVCKCSFLTSLFMTASYKAVRYNSLHTSLFMTAFIQACLWQLTYKLVDNSLHTCLFMTAFIQACLWQLKYKLVDNSLHTSLLITAYIQACLWQLTYKHVDNSLHTRLTCLVLSKQLTLRAHKTSLLTILVPYISRQMFSFISCHAFNATRRTHYRSGLVLRRRMMTTKKRRLGLLGSVTRFCEILPLWQNFKSIWAIFDFFC